MSAPAASGDQQEWKKFLCRACGLIYDERDGDPDSGLPPGTRFEDIPDDWLCPICGVTKVDFEPYTPRARAASPAVATMGPREVGVIVIGAGLAGWSVAAAIRALDADVPVTLVTGCPGDVYHKPELSVALSRGMSPGALRRETGAEAAARLGVHLMAETFAVGLSAVRHRLRTTRGTLPYTSLIIAQGARPALPPGFTPELCWRINNLQAWTGLHRALAGRPQSVAIVGAGMVGCELAEDLARAGHAVTLFGAGRRPLEALLPAAAAARLQTGLEAVGVRFLGASLVEHLARCDNGMVQLRTRDGACFDVDQVVSAIGLATETRLARSAGLDFDKGIVVDPVTLRSSVADIHALGDCASIGGMPCRFIEPIARQADAIAHAVLGRSHVGYAHSDPVIRLKTRSTPIVIRGSPTPGGEWRVLEDTGASLRMEQWQGGAVRARLAA